MDYFVLHFDGSCWPNPGGKAQYGFDLTLNGYEIVAGSGPVGTGPLMSNNVAEYRALYTGLEYVLRWKGTHPGPSKLLIKGDSQLVVKQLNRQWRAWPTGLYFDEYQKTARLLRDIEQLMPVTIAWIPREENQRCDDLSKGVPVPPGGTRPYTVESAA